MNLIENPELKATYDKCKYRVKLWEYNFKKRYGRLPSKLDIREADKEVRFAYKTYFHLKSAAIEHSFKDIDGFQSEEEEDKIEINWNDKVNEELYEKEETTVEDSIWGEHLNNKLEEETKVDEPKSNVNASFSQKLFGGSKFSKRNPRKSLSFQHKKSNTNANIPKTLSQPQENIIQDVSTDISLSQEFFENYTKSSSNNIKIMSTKPEISSQSLDLIQSVLNNDYKLKATLNSGWINRVIEKVGINEQPKLNVDNFNVSRECVKSMERSKSVTYDYDSDDVIANSEDELFEKSACHISKKIKVDLNRSKSCPSVTNLKDNLTKTYERIDGSTDETLHHVEVPPHPPVNNINQGNDSVTPIIENITKCLQKFDAQDYVNIKSSQLTSNKQSPTDNSKSSKKLKNKNVKAKQSSGFKKEKPLRKSTRLKKVVDLSEKSDSEDYDSLEKCPENVLDNSLTSTIQETTKGKSLRKRGTSKTKSTIPKEELLTDQYELEYSVKPRIISVPRITTVKKIIKKPKDADNIPESKENEFKSKKDVAKEKLEKKIASGSLNENFVRINLKKKIYVRGKKTMTFSKYKKQMWKNKKKALSGPNMDMGGCDGGVLTCYNCGDVGHFARQCPRNKGDKLLPLEVVDANDEEECSFPTLEEAERMAQESALAVRKSNKRLIVKETDGSNNENSDEDDLDNLQEDQLNSDNDDDLLLAETIKLEEYVAKLDVRAYIDSTTFVKPYYELNEDGTVIDTPKEVYETLKKFGYSEFRQGQEQAIMRILSGKSTLVTLSTGSGKSLCYQLPAYLYTKREPCIALVISPLVSLMEDQVSGLPLFLKAACLHTNQTKTQRDKVMDLVLSGNLSILLVSPEAVAAGERSTGFGSLLRKLPPISFACIDEAHCVSQWSHNFRPSYLMICKILRERLGVNTILGLTATATVSTANNIVEHLRIIDGAKGIISDVPLPNNLRLTVSRDNNRDYALLGLLLSERFAQCKSVIVYCTRREECERVATFLRMSFKDDKQEESKSSKKRKRTNVQAEPYHAGMSASRRRTIQKNFMSGDLRIVVATVAFGMGINKSDIRSVIHYNMPSSFESYVQEIGRAGRDGLPAHCHLFLDSQGNDENELRRHIHANSMDRHVIRKLLQKIFIPCSCKLVCPKHEVAFSIQDVVMTLDVPEENIATLLCYLELHENRFVEVLSPAYTTCKVISYRGPVEIRKAAKECPPLAMALALHGDRQKQENIFEFPVVDVASAMGWDSGICKHKLKNLEWTIANNLPKRSSLSVQFSNLGFRLVTSGNLTDTQLDQTLDYLYQRVVDQEKMCLMQLRAVHTTLASAAAKTYRTCLSEEIADNEKVLKEKIREYFNSKNPLVDYEKAETKPVVEEQIINDTRQLVSMYRDNNFTGRAVARIFHGIQSPNYPAVMWGRCKFWRSHLKDDFHEICRIATREILKLR